MELNDTTDTDSTDSVAEQTRTTNHEGGEAYEPASAKLQLYKRTINNLLENTFYEDDEELYEAEREAFDAAANEDPEFVLQLAAYARQEMGLRDVPQVLLAFAARDDRFKTHPPEPGHHEDTMIRDYTPEIVQRMDETATVVSIYLNTFEQDTLPHCLKTGLSDAINQMVDEYTLAKYRLERREVTLYDVFNLVRPDPTDRVENWHGLTVDERRELFERFMRGNLDEYDVDDLDTPNTWETVISNQGNTADAWRQVLPDMGIMAKIRNVRNMLEAGLTGDEIFTEENLDAARHSKMFPFRFYQSYKAYKNAPGVEQDVTVEEFLTDAIDQTADNLPDELENTLVVADTSGSMNQPVSGRSTLQCYEIATFFAGVASTAGADVGAFADTFEETDFHHQTPSVERMEEIQRLDVGGATNGHKVFDRLREQDRKYDNVVLLTDEQMWDSEAMIGGLFDEDKRTLKEAYDEYRTEVTSGVNLYNIDLQAYGTLSMPEGYEDVYHVSGWTEKVLDFITYAEQEREIIHEIEEYNPV